MRTKTNTILPVVIVLTVSLGLSSSAAAGPPYAVSPGGALEVTTIDQRCPTFSWGGAAEATALELVVFRLPEGGAALETSEPVLRKRLPVGASSWTPARADCLEPGGRYGWVVMTDGEAGTSDWSEPRLFEVFAGLSLDELQATLTLLLDAYRAGGGSLESLDLDPAASGRRPRPEGPGTAAVHPVESPSHRQPKALPAAAAILGEQTDPTGTTLGVGGSSASPEGFGLAAVNTAGGADLLLDGAADGQTDTVVDQAGLDRPSASPETFTFGNSGGGGITLTVAGDVALSGLVDGVDVSAHAGDADAHHAPPTALPPSGPAGGDLTGTFPDPEVVNDSHAHTDATVADGLSLDNGRLFAPAGAGNVGIGTAFPAQPLDVNGNVNVGGSLFLGGNLFLHEPTGGGNTAVGSRALHSNTSGQRNTATGLQALFLNTTGLQNTATGHLALSANTGGGNNTATGGDALRFNTIGSFNTAIGSDALQENTTGNGNTAIGADALRDNTTGFANTATGEGALLFNTTGSSNTAMGETALFSNSSGISNTAIGQGALFNNTTARFNTALGAVTLGSNTTGDRNTAVGAGAGNNNTSGSHSIFIGSGAAGTAGDSNVIRIGGTTVGNGFGEQDHTFINGIRGVTTDLADAVPVLIDSAGQLGTVSSSRRFKKDIEDMGDTSSRLLELRPVTFHYRQEPVQGGQPLQFGLIAEEVAAVLPELVVYDDEGRPETVRYHLLSSMLLNELQKQAGLDRKQQEEIAEIAARLEALQEDSPPIVAPPADRHEPAREGRR